MDKEKLKRYAGYAGLGILGGELSLVSLSIYNLIVPGIGDINIKVLAQQALIAMFFGLSGGLIGRTIAKKWWSAFLGGFLITGIIYILIGIDYV